MNNTYKNVDEKYNAYLESNQNNENNNFENNNNNNNNKKENGVNLRRNPCLTKKL